MKNVRITPSELHGFVNAPSSKSVAHRALICATLSMGKCIISNVDMNNDIKATALALKMMGADIQIEERVIKINSFKANSTALVDCAESASTLRFLIPVCAALGIRTTFSGKGRLPFRTTEIYRNILSDSLIVYPKEKDTFLPLEISGKAKSGIFNIPGNISSQFITGVMLCAPVLCGKSEIVITTELESKPYVDITINIMKKFGADVTNEGNSYIIGSSQYKPCDFKIEGDYSQAAFFACAGVLSGDIKIGNLDEKSSQGDKKILEILKQFGADISFEHGILCAKKSDKLHGIVIDAQDIPDLVPILSVVASAAYGKTEIINAGRLRLKESDRIKSTCKMINDLGGEAIEGKDCITINGKGKLDGGFVSTFNDHRIAMSAAVASTICKNDVIVDDFMCQNKSYPEFLNVFTGLQG